MRRRHVSEMVRDSRVGAIIIAKLIAGALAWLIAALSFPVAGVVGRVVNWIGMHAFRDVMLPMDPLPILWWNIVGSILECAVTLVFALVFASWVYTPRRRGTVP